MSDVMTTGVESCLEDDEISEAARRIAELRIHRLIVFDGNSKLSGFVSLGEIAIEHHGDVASVTREKISHDN